MHKIISRFYKHILLTALIITVVSIGSAARLDLNPNFFSLLPVHNEEVTAFFDTVEEIGLNSLLIAVIELPPQIDQAAAEAFIDVLAENYADSNLIRAVEYKSTTNELASVFQIVIEHLSLFLGPSEFTQLARKLTDNEIHAQIRENKQLLMSPLGMAMQDLVLHDPLAIREIIPPYASIPPDYRPLKPYRGHYRIGDTRTYLIFMKPIEPPQNIPFSKRLMEEVRHLEDVSLSDFGNDAKSLQDKVMIAYTGGYPIAVADEATTRKDIILTVLTSFLAVLILFAAAFRTTRVLVYVAASLATSLIWTLGFAGTVFHSLNVLTAIFSCVLIGLGIDFAIHITNRYFSADKIDLPIPVRLEETFREAGSGIIIGGLTTAMAFYSVAISNFRGFRELGIVTGTGILLCLVVMLCVLPSLLVFFAGSERSHRKITIRGFGLTTFIAAILKNPRFVLIVSLICTVGLASFGFQIRFDDNLRNFRPAASAPFALQEKVSGWLGGSLGEAFLVSEARSEIEALQLNSRIYEALQELEGGNLVAGVRSLHQFIRSPEIQQKNTDIIRRQPDAFDIGRIQTTFSRALAENGFQQLKVYDRYLEDLSGAFATHAVILPSSLTGGSFDRLLKPFFFQKDGKFTTVTYIVPVRDLWSRHDTSRFKAAITDKMDERGIPENRYILTGPNLLTGDLKTLIMENLTSALWLVCVAIAFVLILYYRKVTFFMLAGLPLVIGLATLAGIMVLLQLDFNFFNIIVLPMIVGIGIDDGIHLTNTFRRGQQDILSDSIAGTGRAVVLTSLTTLAGFGSIALSHYPGLKSMGYVAIIGIGGCLAASLIVLPALFAIIRSRDQS